MPTEPRDGSSTVVNASSSAVSTAPTVGNKRRLSATGSRGVTSLTPEQLTKKRANDREAQRAIRERTKNQIETLEKRVLELTSQEPYQELQAVLRQKEAVQTENDEIRRRLSSALAILQPILNTQSINGEGEHRCSLQLALRTSSLPARTQVPCRPLSMTPTAIRGWDRIP